MKKILAILFLSSFAFVFSQKTPAKLPVYTIEQVEKTTDVKVIAAFLKANPNHPRSEEFKRKMVLLLGGSTGNPAAKPVIKPLDPVKVENAVKKDIAENGSVEKHKAAANILTKLFNEDPNSKDAYIQIINKSKCRLVVKISGKKYYNLSVPPKGQEFIIVDKGTYTLTTDVCDAKYSSVKNITKNLTLALDTN